MKSYLFTIPLTRIIIKITVDKRKIYSLKLTKVRYLKSPYKKRPYKKRPWITPVSSPWLLGLNKILYIGRKMRKLLILFTPNIKSDKIFPLLILH